MFFLKVLGSRRSVLAFHRCETETELNELLAVYHALGYADTALLIEDRRQEQAA